MKTNFKIKNKDDMYFNIKTDHKFLILLLEMLEKNNTNINYINNNTFDCFEFETEKDFNIYKEKLIKKIKESIKNIHPY